MKKLEDCKAYFQDVYTDWLESDRYGKELDRCTMISETLRFIYGASFETIEPIWRKEALDAYYAMLAKKDC